MSNPVKIALYLALAVLAGISGYFALTGFAELMNRAGDRGAELEQIEPERKPANEPPSNSTGETNVAGAGADSTNQASAAASNTNNAATNHADAAAVDQPPKAISTTTSNDRGSGGRRGRIGFWAATLILSLAGLGLLTAHDVSQYFGNKALRVLYNDEGEGLKNPEYERAEQVWANGRHLEAIGLMREYLEKNPREQHVALRIAEIYEKDLGNFLAAALEYEEVLKHKLAPERWSWAAIHLCNLYFKLNQEQKAYELLRRLVKEHPNTAAAEKARKRLEQVDGMPLSEPMAEPSSNPKTERAEAPAPRSNLPPGFRPKK